MFIIEFNFIGKFTVLFLGRGGNVAGDKIQSGTSIPNRATYMQEFEFSMQ